MWAVVPLAFLCGSLVSLALVFHLCTATTFKANRISAKTPPYRYQGYYQRRKQIQVGDKWRQIPISPAPDASASSIWVSNCRRCLQENSSTAKFVLGRMGRYPSIAWPCIKKPCICGVSPNAIDPSYASNGSHWDPERFFEKCVEKMPEIRRWDFRP